MTECSLPADNIPLGWYALELKLSELAESLDRDVLYKDECFAAAQKLHFEVDSFEAALKYLDELNIIFYYPSILPGVVFASIQVLLDKASELVEFIFQLSERRERQELCTGEQKRFADHGLVSVAFLQQFDRHYVPGLFTPEDLVKLFRALLILADFHSPEYFMPCLLQTLTSEEVGQHRDSSSSCVVPLVLHFPDGVRNGLFCSLIAFLLSPENCFPAPWEILLRQGTSTPVCLNRNCVEFTIPYRPGIVRIIDSFAFFEVHATMPARFCDHIRNAVFTGLKKAASTLGYNISQPEPAIICPCKEGDLHPAVVLPKEDLWICSCDSQIYGQLTEDQLFWHNLKATSPAVPGNQISPSPHPPQSPDIQSIPGTSSGSQTSSSEASSHTQQTPDTWSGSATAPGATPVGKHGKKPRLAQLIVMRTATGEKIHIIYTLAPQWKDVGYLLDFDPDGQLLDIIETDHKGSGAVTCCREMFKLWLAGSGQPATWEVLIGILDDLDYKHLVKQIKCAIGL